MKENNDLFNTIGIDSIGFYAISFKSSFYYSLFHFLHFFNN